MKETTKINATQKSMLLQLSPPICVDSGM